MYCSDLVRACRTMHYLLNLHVIHIILDVLFHLSPAVTFQSVFLLFRGETCLGTIYAREEKKNAKQYFGHSSDLAQGGQKNNCALFIGT